MLIYIIAAEPEHDERKKNGMAWMVAILTAVAVTGLSS